MNRLYHGMKFREIKAIVCNDRGISIEEFDGRVKTNRLVHARHLAWWLARKYTDLSYPRIAYMSGERDHSTIMYGVSMHEFRQTGVMPERMMRRIMKTREKKVLKRAPTSKWIESNENVL